MAATPFDGTYWETHFPLGLQKILSNLLKRNEKNPNIPAVVSPPAERQWLSAPRSSKSYTLKHSVYTFGDAADFFTPEGLRTVLGTDNLTPDYGADLDPNQKGYGAQIARLLDPNQFNWFPIAYNSVAFPMHIGVEHAVETAVGMILNSSSKVFLIGHGMGAVVASKVYDEFRTGRLVSKQSLLLGIYNFGSPMREQGQTIPDGIDPGGHGIAPEAERLIGTEPIVWEFASPNDPLTIQYDDDVASEIASLIYSSLYYDVESIDTLMEELTSLVGSDLFGRLPVLLPFKLAIADQTSIDTLVSLYGRIPSLLPFRFAVVNQVTIDYAAMLATLISEFFSNGGSHDQYHSLFPIEGNTNNAVDLALLSIMGLAEANQPVTVGDNSTEVLTINYRNPVSISEISFETLRNSVYIELWFLDRTNNWRQVLDENSSPLTLRAGYSSNLSWYKFHSYTYPMVAKALQIRIRRVYDPLMGDKPYSVGLREILVRRNVYNRSSGLQGMEDETDAFGNVISKVIKDWDAFKAIDDNSSTFWRSSAQPDPDAVVNFFLDTRDNAGNSQLVDKIYIDPVYAGQSLNLYYSNDETLNNRKLDPSSVLPVPMYQIATAGFMTIDSSEGGKVATLELNVSPSVVVGDVISVTNVSTDLDGTFAITDAQYTAPFSVSYNIDSSTPTLARTACNGEVSVKGQDNFEWVVGSGLIDTIPSDDNSSISVYRCPFNIGPMVNKDCWIGIQWSPSFDAYTYRLLVSPPNAFTPNSSQIATTADGASGTGSVATIEFDSDPGISIGDLITVSDVLPDGYNGTYTVTDTSSGPYTVSYSCTEVGEQTQAGVVTIGAEIDLAAAMSDAGLVSPTINNVYSVYDRTNGNLLYSKARDEGATLDGSTLRIPAAGVPDICSSTDTLLVYYEPSGPSPTQLTLFETVPETSIEDQSWTRIYYDTNTAEINLEFLFPDNAPPLVFTAPLLSLVEKNTPINLIVGWRYAENGNHTVRIAARTSGQMLLTYNPITQEEFLDFEAFSLPDQIIFDGKMGFKQWRGKFGAHIVKEEAFDLPTDSGSTSSEDFLANPITFCNPDPVLVPTESTIAPVSSLDSSIFAVDWTSQQFASGGTHHSVYTDKEWTPIWVNYTTEKGFLHLPRTTLMKYLKLEFTLLSPEPYPVYDTGIKVSYQVFPITITQTQEAPPGILGRITNIFSSILSINWLNPSSIANAVRSIFGTTVQPVQTQMQIGPGYTTNTLPNTTQTAVTTSVRTEASSPAVFRRTPFNVGSLAKNFINNLFSQGGSQGLKSLISPLHQKLISDQTTVTVPTSASPAAVPIQGQDWWVFPGQTLRMPANVIKGVTFSQVLTNRKNSKAIRTRFTTTAVHQYETRTITLDANIGYFAGIREIQPYTVAHIDYEDPPEFRFDNYDLTDWSAVNVTKYQGNSDSTCISANPNPYQVTNSGFDASINYWEGEGWDWNTTHGHTISETWQPGTPFMHGSAHVTADGTLRSLLSDPITITPGDVLNVSAWVVYKNLEFTTGAKIYVDLIGIDENDDPIGNPISLGQYMMITDDEELGLPELNTFPVDQPASSVPQIGVEAILLYGSVDMSEVVGHETTERVRISLNVSEEITAGDVWFDDVEMEPGAGVIGSIQKTILTKSKFSKVKLDFSDSGFRRSDPMWAKLDNSGDPRRTVLAHYVSTIPDPNVLTGSWGDIITEWEDTDVGWGAPYAEIDISYSQMVYDNKRTIHFYRNPSPSSTRAGIVVRQELNFAPQVLYRICATFFKEKRTDNTMTFSLWRISGNEEGSEGPDQYPYGNIHTETLNDVPIGQWYTYQGQWNQTPNHQDQVYKVQLELSGDDVDDLYLNDLWVEIAQIRYHVQLGADEPHDVTTIISQDNATVGTTEGVNQIVIGIELHGDKSFAYSASLTPLYLC